ncbi:transposase [Streptomyces sp. NBC_00663]|uniref:transposase n=1 Tax=Streptomyces sp. NBC_00663 TaxID=2975801 RepID=UPI002E315100|nr:transposase [Streptomyces sp. NBC_00663]
MTCPDELREPAIREVRTTGRPVAYVAKDLGIHKEALRQWVRQAEADHGERDDRLTTADASARIDGSHSSGYLPIEQGDGPHLVEYAEIPLMVGAGGTTAKDPNRFVDALLDGRLLPARLLAEMQTPGVAGRNYEPGPAWKDTSCGFRPTATTAMPVA